MIETIQRAGRRAFSLFEHAFDAAFGPRINPLYHLGALSFFFFWVVAASGIYVYVFFETSIDGAYRSVEYLTHTQWYAGGVARGLHISRLGRQRGCLALGQFQRLIEGQRRGR